MSSSNGNWKDAVGLVIIAISLLLIGLSWGILSARSAYEGFECTSAGVVDGTPECLIYERRVK